MITIIDNTIRVGRFTSGEIHRLLSNGKRPMTEEELKARPKEGEGSKAKMHPDGPGKAFYSYVEDKRMERKLGRLLNEDVTARPLEWGKLVEVVASRKLPYGYDLASRETIVHPTIDSWCGTPDGTSEDAVYDIKCPYTIKSFCCLHDCNSIAEVRDRHDSGEAYYWQLVSNSILTNKKFAELIVYMPYLSELREVKAAIDTYEGDPNKVAFIHFAQDHDLPYLVDGGGYKNLHIIRFEVPEQDKKRLTARVELAARLLKA